MPVFELRCCRERDAQKAIFFYNSETSELMDVNREVIDFSVSGIDKGGHYETISKRISPDNPGCKKAEANDRFRIQLGLKCNSSCAYCIQSESNHSSIGEGRPVKDLVALIPEASPEKFRKFEFWGGEPFLYWDILKPLAEAIRKRFPDDLFYISTNGLLLDHSKVLWLDKQGFFLAVSHDGPGQFLRGADPLRDSSLRDVLFHAFHLLSPKGRFSFNPIISRQNCDRIIINNWFIKELKQTSFTLGEGSIIHPMGNKHMDHILITYEEHIRYRLNMLYSLRGVLAPNFSFLFARPRDFISSIRRKRNWDKLGNICGADDEGTIAVDLAGNLLGCHNLAASDITPSGFINNIGTLDKIESAQSRTTKHWSYREECRLCPIIQLCRGGCPHTPDNYRKALCANMFSDTIPIFAYSIEKLTGYLPYYIEGPQSEDRKDIFAIIENNEEGSIFI